MKKPKMLEFFAAALRAIIPERELVAGEAWLQDLKNKGIRLPAPEPAPIRLRGPNGRRELVLSLDAMPYPVRDGVAEDVDDGGSTLEAELFDQGFDHVEADYVIAVNYEKCPAKDLCRRLGCDAREVERRATSVRRRIDRMRYAAAVAHEKTFLNGFPVEPFPED